MKPKADRKINKTKKQETRPATAATPNSNTNYLKKEIIMNSNSRKINLGDLDNKNKRTYATRIKLRKQRVNRKRN